MSDSAEWTAEERAAMKERAAEARAAKRGAKSAEADLAKCLEKIAEMGPAERALAQRIHDIVTATAPDLTPKTWYGMPAYAKSGKVVCFFQPGEKFGSRYSTLGFQDPATLDEGAMWPTAYAITAIGDAEAEIIAQLVRKAAG